MTASADWSTQFWGLWRMEENSGTRADSSGNGRDLAEVGGTAPAAAAVEGAASVDLIDAQESLSRATDNLSAQSITFGCWAYPTESGGGDIVGRWASNVGWQLERRVSGARSLCRVGAVSDSFQSPGVMDQDTWTHAVCAYSAASGNIQSYANGLADTVDAGVATLAASATNLRVGTGDSAGKLQARIDECFVFAGRLDTAAICRVCSCGVNGAACSCSGIVPTQYADTGRNATMCGGCALPACNLTAPGVS